MKKGLDPRRFSIRTAPALIAKSAAWRDYCEGKLALRPTAGFSVPGGFLPRLRHIRIWGNAATWGTICAPFTLVKLIGLAMCLLCFGERTKGQAHERAYHPTSGES